MAPNASELDDCAELTDSGFAVLRTPLLPIEAFEDWTRRTKEAVESSGLTGDAALAAALEEMRENIADPAFRDAIRVASVALSDEIDAWCSGARKIDSVRLLHSLVRYFGRACFRPTPFGLFAGCTVVDVRDDTRLELCGRGGYVRHSRIGMDHLAELARTLSVDPECRRQVPLRTNETIAMMGGRLHYVETRYAGRLREYLLAAADPTREVLIALDRARRGVSFSALSEVLVSEGYTKGEVEAFITELLDTQLLVPDLEPIVSGGDAAAEFATVLEASDCAPNVSSALREVGARLREIDARGLDGKPDYDGAVSPLRGLSVRVDEEKILQVDLYKPPSNASVGRIVIEDAVEAIRVLARISPDYDLLEGFAKRFQERYETRDVPLLEVLDEEIGIGIPRPDDALLRRTSEAAHRREGLLAELRCRAAYARGTEVILTDEDLQRLQTASGRPLPDALAFSGSIVASSGDAVDRGEYRLLVNHIIGPSGARMLGRFAHLDKSLQQRIREHLAAEESLRPDAVFAEIIHLPHGRIGNVIARPTLREYELSYLGKGSVPAERQLELGDLRVSVRRGRVRLTSARLDREVIPRLSTAHNFGTESELPVYRFLCYLQSHGSLSVSSWTWGSQEGASFLPRVIRGRLILSRARWRLSVRDVERVNHAARRADYREIDAWRVSRELPALVHLEQGDNRLPIDFENPASALAFARLLSRKSTATIVEAVPGPGELCVSGPEGHFTNEIVIPLVRNALSEAKGSTPSIRLRASSRDAARPVVRAYVPGSQWLYAKLYCGRGSADGILRDFVAPLVDQAKNDLPALQWHFIRYSDPHFHIRLRFKESVEAVPHLFALLGAAAEPEVANGRIARVVFDTYFPEVERYGGPEAIEIAEQAFNTDSEAALTAIGKYPPTSLQNVPRDLITLAGVDRLLEDADLSLETRILLLNRALGTVASSVRRARSEQFRSRRSSIAQILKADGGGDELDLLRSLLDGRSAVIRPLLAQLRSLDRRGLLESPIEDVVMSLSHMWVNRTLPDVIEIEPLLYDRLDRAYRSHLGRTRATPSTSVESSETVARA